MWKRVETVRFMCIITVHSKVSSVPTTTSKDEDEEHMEKKRNKS